MDVTERCACRVPQVILVEGAEFARFFDGWNERPLPDDVYCGRCGLTCDLPPADPQPVRMGGSAT